MKIYRPKLRVLRLASLVIVTTLVFSVSCATLPPRNIDDVCYLFDKNYDWYIAAKRTHEKWGSPPHITMAIMHQESSFRAKAKPPRTKILGFIPGPRKSTAFGYAQALDPTWAMYLKKSGLREADRDDFSDAIDFIGWYNHYTHRRNKIALSDAERLYLAYHEGQGGYSRGTYRKKPWLMGVAKKVKRQASSYQSQLATCRADLETWTIKRWFTSLI